MTQSDKTEEELSAEEAADRERKVIAKRSKHNNPQFLSPSQVGLEARRMAPCSYLLLVFRLLCIVVIHFVER